MAEQLKMPAEMPQIVTDSENPTRSKDRKRCENSDNSDVPKRTSEWTQETLDLLRIAVVRDKLYHPKEFFAEWITSVLATKRTADLQMVEEKANMMIKHMEKYNPLQTLDFESIYDIDPYRFTEAREGECECVKWATVLPSLYGETHWMHMFSSHCDMFVENLKYMISQRDKGKCETESMYVTLFQNFVGICGLHCVSAAVTEKLDIGETEVSSTPDILLMDKMRRGCDKKILVLVEAKQLVTDTDTASNLPSIEKSSKICKDFYISDRLFGQHGGDLLLHRHLSSDMYGMMGIILEKTYITFSYFKCSEEQFETIRKGNANVLENQPSLMFSRKYNYLKSSDREYLMEPLIKIGLLQRTV